MKSTKSTNEIYSEIHNEIHNEICGKSVMITHNLVDFMTSNSISLKPIGFHIHYISWNPPHFTEIHRILQDFYEINTISHEMQQILQK